MNTYYGFKQSQSQDYDAKGTRVPLTWIKIEPLTVIAHKSNSLQIAFGTRKHPNKPTQGLLRLATLAQDKSSKTSEKINPRFIRELKLDQSDNLDQYSLGSKIQVTDIFSAGDKVKVTGTSKGKGFAGVMKRHGFHGGPKTHGQSTKARHPGSIGAGTTPGRIYKGKRMAGHMGMEQVTVRNLEIFAVKPEENLILVKGLVPGNKGNLVKLTKLTKRS